MSRIQDELTVLKDQVFGFARSTKDTYDTGTRFLKMRVWIVLVLAIDAVLTLGFVLFTGGQPLNIVIWYQPGFPANMLVVRNENGRVLKDVTLVLDGRYSYEVERIEKGVNGFDVNRSFHDHQDYAPPPDYRPSLVEVRLDGDTLKVPIGAQNRTGQP